MPADPWLIRATPDAFSPLGSLDNEALILGYKQAMSGVKRIVITVSSNSRRFFGYPKLIRLKTKKKQKSGA